MVKFYRFLGQALRKSSGAACLWMFGSLAAAAPEPLTIMVPLQGTAHVQDASLDRTGQVLLVQTVELQPDGSEHARLLRYRLDPPDAAPRLEQSTRALPWLGHQGVSIERLDSNGRLWLWASTTRPRGRGAVRFTWDSDGTLSAPAHFILIPPGDAEYDSAMPEVCADGKHLVIRSRNRTKAREQALRRFSLSDLNDAGPGDRASLTTAVIPISDLVLSSGTPLQGLACDTDTLYLVTGNARANEPKHLYALDWSGQVLRHDTGPWFPASHTSGTERFYEPEGLQAMPTTANRPTPLWLGAVIGAGAAKKLWLINIPGQRRIGTKESP
jgi:hypothetical protein